MYVCMHLFIYLNYLFTNLSINWVLIWINGPDFQLVSQRSVYPRLVHHPLSHFLFFYSVQIVLHIFSKKIVACCLAKRHQKCQMMWDIAEITGVSMNMSAQRHRRLLERINSLRFFMPLSCVPSSKCVRHIAKPITGIMWLALPE